MGVEYLVQTLGQLKPVRFVLVWSGLFCVLLVQSGLIGFMSVRVMQGLLWAFEVSLGFFRGLECGLCLRMLLMMLY